MAKNVGEKPKLPAQQLAILAVARFAEPLAYTSVFPYLPDMIRDFGVAEDQIAEWAGLTSATFSIFQSITAVAWGKAADYFGRKPVLIAGLLNTMICFVVWGMATSLPMAIIVRAVQGGGNGNVGIIRTMVAELVPQKELQPKAFSIMPLVWSLGSVVGPAFGGFLAQPATQYPDIFGNIAYFKRFPYALPNLVATVFFLISVAGATLFLKETLATKKEKKDRGLLVGERLTRAFTRKRPDHTTHRRRSFVDGEATAPLFPSNVLPKNDSRAEDSSSAPSSPKMSEVFTCQTIINLLAYSLLAFHSVAYDQNIAVFMHYRHRERTPDNFKPPFYFDGGFGMSTGQRGTVFVIYGIICGLVQFILYPPLATRYGVLRCFQVCSIVIPVVYLITPYASLFPTEKGRLAALLSIMAIKAFAIIIAFPSTTILLTNSCTSLRVLGTLNGFATMFSGLGRALGPASTGWVFSWGASHGYVVAAYFYLALIAIIGAVPVFLIAEGDGISASSASSHSSDASSENGSEGSSNGAAIIPSESAVDDEEVNDENGEPENTRQPLLGKKSSSSYGAISERS